MDNAREIDMENDAFRFCVSFVSCIVANHRWQIVILSWKQRPIAGKINFTVQTVFTCGNKCTNFNHSLGIPYYCTWILWTLGNWLIPYIFVLSNSCSNLSNLDCKYNFVAFNYSFQWFFTSKKILRAEVITITWKL